MCALFCANVCGVVGVLLGRGDRSRWLWSMTDGFAPVERALFFWKASSVPGLNKHRVTYLPTYLPTCLHKSVSLSWRPLPFFTCADTEPLYGDRI